MPMSSQALSERLAANGYVLNGYLQMPSAAAAEIYARQGWDVVTLDLEHGSIGFDTAVAMLQAISASKALPFARIPTSDAALIGMLLDSGVLGITCAMVNTVADAEALVRACRYPPRGDRSLSRFSRASLVHGPDYNARADRLISVFAMIETAEGLRNVEAIAAVDGLDGLYLGSVDLAMSVLGRMPQIGVRDPAIDAVVDDAMARVVACCRASGIVAGINAPGPEEGWRMIERGFRFLTLSSDVRALTVQSKSWVDGLRSLASAQAAGR